jgi:transcription-repair coupling factor (superfamily II helicase)
MKLTLTPHIPAQGDLLSVTGLRGAAPAALAASLAAKTSLCCILPDENMVQSFASDLELFTSLPILLYPDQETPPYTPLSPDRSGTATRLSTLYRLRSGEPFILVASTASLQRRILPPAVLADCAEYLEAGEDFDQQELATRLTRMGYEKVALVQSAGNFSLRGGIIDLYPPPFLTGNGTLCDAPLRIDFFGDTIESLRLFDPVSQRSTDEISDATVLPVSDILLSPERPEQRRLSRLYAKKGEELDWESSETHRLMENSNEGIRFPGMEFFLPFYCETEPATVFDALPANCLLTLIDPGGIREAMGLAEERALANFQTARLARTPALPPEQLFLSPKEIATALARFRRIDINDFPKEGEQFTVNTSGHQLLKQEIQLKRSKIGMLAPLSDQIHEWRRQGERVVICCRSSRHTKNIAEMLEKHSHQLNPVAEPLDLAALAESDPELLHLCDHPLSSGFSLTDNGLHIISESEIFGEMRIGSRKKQPDKGEPIRFTELNEGDIVVHREHGLGIYRGLSTMDFQGVTSDFMLIEYRDGDRLYLPVDRLNLISRYQGISDREPRLDKLGSQAWSTTTSRIKEEVWKVAQELLNIYAKREIKEGRQFAPPGALYHELEESFPWDETPGQAAAINDVLDDLTSPRPMDRLVCGDVGYGKTEVAIRAAFKVVEEGCQAAILVPTTVLAEQHIQTFTERLKGFPVTIACLNRFRTGSEQRQILKDLAAGKIDIIIGTHRLLSKDIIFHDLGLLVIDEEHRFGVTHKEKLKKMRAEVDILTLTATPIPRTLQMSLLSIRDLSVISTPPAHRRPVKTFVAPFDTLVIKEAITKELRRGGQVFFVHNRVKSIHKTAALIQELVPEARIAVAHGQMDGSELEKIMVSFVSGKVNVLVATTIIESGLDIPAANTIIINRADMLGLAEIYQLRGRVGRASEQSFAYLLVPSLDDLTRDSKERLRALMDTSGLGGGFKLAMSDLQIRGGGNILGISQSGNIAAIGYDLYLDLLQKTVTDLKAQQAEGNAGREEIDPEVKLLLSAHIPKSYIPDISQRYITYRRIASLVGAEEERRDELEAELRDRYGTLPAETSTLLHIISVKRELARLRIAKLEQGPDSLIFTFLNDTPLTPEMLLAFLAAHPKTKKRKAAKFTPDGRLVHYCLRGKSEAEVFAAVSESLREFHKLLKEAK